MSGQPQRFTFWHGLLLAEGAAVLIGLASTIVPGKSGSRFGISGYFFAQPTFVQELLVNIVFAHLVLLVLAIGIYLYWRWNRRDQ